LLALRTREALEWHFKFTLAANRIWIAAIPDGVRLAAYAIFQRDDNRNSGLKRVRLVDYQSIDGSADLLSPILSWALDRCHQGGIQALESTGRWLGAGEFMDTAAPYRRKLATWTYYYRANERGLEERLTNPLAWECASSFDGDATL
jgi:hypothetical protein